MFSAAVGGPGGVAHRSLLDRRLRTFAPRHSSQSAAAWMPTQRAQPPSRRAGGGIGPTVRDGRAALWARRTGPARRAQPLAAQTGLGRSAGPRRHVDAPGSTRAQRRAALWARRTGPARRAQPLACLCVRRGARVRDHSRASASPLACLCVRRGFEFVLRPPARTASQRWPGRTIAHRTLRTHRTRTHCHGTIPPRPTPHAPIPNWQIEPPLARELLKVAHPHPPGRPPRVRLHIAPAEAFRSPANQLAHITPRSRRKRDLARRHRSRRIDRTHRRPRRPARPRHHLSRHRRRSLISRARARLSRRRRNRKRLDDPRRQTTHIRHTNAEPIAIPTRQHAILNPYQSLFDIRQPLKHTLDVTRGDVYHNPKTRHSSTLHNDQTPLTETTAPGNPPGARTPNIPAPHPHTTPARTQRRRPEKKQGDLRWIDAIAWNEQGV